MWVERCINEISIAIIMLSKYDLSNNVVIKKKGCVD
jgi:hypothetical protein